MRLTFLGTGTSFGVPVIGCGCGTCTSDDPRDRRTRHAALLDLPGGRLLVDTPPELRLQLLGAGVGDIDAVWYTHFHADHLHGIDDLRVFSSRKGHDLPAWVASGQENEIVGRFPYIFDDRVPPLPGSTRPGIALHAFEPGTPVSILGARFQPLSVPHGPLDVFGFRVGNLGYVTDAKRLPEAALRTLGGVDVLVLNALWRGNPHPSHFNVEEAVEAARQVGARETWLTHMTHRLRHASLERELPPGIRPAYDGLEVDFDLELNPTSSDPRERP